MGPGQEANSDNLGSLFDFLQNNCMLYTQHTIS